MYISMGYIFLNRSHTYYQKFNQFRLTKKVQTYLVTTRYVICRRLQSSEISEVGQSFESGTHLISFEYVICYFITALYFPVIYLKCE